MAGSFPYTIVPNKLPGLLAKIRTVGIPERVTNSWLSSIGFTSSNDRSMLRVLRYLGFIDESGSPTKLWREYRGGQYRAVLASAMASAYREVFGVYPNAQRRATEELQNFFSARSDMNRDTIGRVVSTFQTLCAEADFESSGEASRAAEEPEDTRAGLSSVASKPRARGLTVNVNVQLTLPESTNEEVYEKLFAAMERHLLRALESDD